MLGRGFLFLFLCAFLLFGDSGWIFARDVPGKNVELNAAAELIKKQPADIYVLDVRTPSEFKEGHLPGAHNMDFWGATFEYDIKKLPKDKKILLYCRTGRRSAGAREMLEKEGYENLIEMGAGYDAWAKAGLPVEK